MFIEREHLREIFDPGGVVRSLDHGLFYKHANPPGLGKRSFHGRMSEASHVYRKRANNDIFDP